MQTIAKCQIGKIKNALILTKYKKSTTNQLVLNALFYKIILI